MKFRITASLFFRTLGIITFIALIAFVAAIALFQPKSPTVDIIQSKIDHIPIGDRLYAEVYTFIKDAFIEENKKSWTSEQIQNLIKSERENFDNLDHKPYTVTTAEGELSGLLRLLCQSDKYCYSLTLYQKEGVEFAHGASSSYDHEISTEGGKENDLNLGVLTNPMSRLGLRELNSQAKAYELIQICYLDPERRFAQLSTTPPQVQSSQILGYVRYVFR